MTEANLIRSIQRWEYEGGRMLQPEHLHRRCLTQNLTPVGAGRRLELHHKEAHRSGCGSEENEKTQRVRYGRYKDAGRERRVDF